MKQMLRQALGWLDQIENILIAVLAVTLVFLAGLQVVLRLTNEGLVWLDPLLRVLVIWAGLLGAVAAARSDRHINLDVIGRLLSGRALVVTRLVTMLFAALVCAVLIKSSLGLIQIDRESANMLTANVPMWWAELILPVAFSLLTLRFIISAFTPEQPQSR